MDKCKERDSVAVRFDRNLVQWGLTEACSSAGTMTTKKHLDPRQ